MTPGPLAGFTVGVTAARRREELGAALERRGARIVYGPAIRIVPLADDTELLDATRRCLSAPPDVLVATTGIGFRGWMDAAETWDLADELQKALGGASILARGPKARGAVRACGLREDWSPESESSGEVLDHLLSGVDVAGRRVAVQLHGEPLPGLVEGLRDAGAEVIEVPVYRWVPPDDEQPLRKLIELVAAASVDAVAFTSAPAAANFLRTAAQQDVDVVAPLRDRVLAACVGPVTAGPLERAGIPVVQPARARLGALAREIVDQLGASRTVDVQAAGHRLELRSQGAVVDGAFVALAGTPMALLRELAVRPGHVLSREDLVRHLPGDGCDGHAVEVAIARLRAALGDPAIIATVVKRGYRLAV